MIEIILLVLAILLCLLISWEDFRSGVIKNKYILLILILGLIFRFISGDLQTNFLNILLTIVYGTVISFLFWWLGLWPAGDAKLLSVMMFFFPTDMYVSFALIFKYLVNTFVPIFIFMMLILLFKSRFDLIKEAIKYSLEPYKVFMLIIMFLGFSWLSLKLIALFGIPTDFFVSIIVLFVIYEIFYSILTIEIELLFLAVAILRIIVDFKTIFTWNFMFNFSVTILSFIFFRFFVLYIGYVAYTKSKKILELEPGMSPAEGVVFEKGKYGKVSFLTSSFFEFMTRMKYRFIHNLDTFTEEDVKQLKKLYKQKKLGFDNILITQRQHFGIFILLGFLITLILKQNFILFLIQYF